jgi:hypothetical protein
MAGRELLPAETVALFGRPSQQEAQKQKGADVLKVVLHASIGPLSGRNNCRDQQGCSEPV